ncbi:MAG: ammonium transporter [Candidatus Diapherotrites archaeon]|uniref:Ammonium transporter n=1 Tax=Candidatus Iainarchaeum sp. TaxID=3101447 RepID=A0A8T3YIP3_9ARCH|nr:ammonium transporter [Candidatus Diapherotrites archaeon]
MKRLLLFTATIVFAAFAHAETGISAGDVAWVATASALVMLMTPALGFFYAGLVREKNLVSTLAQCMAIFAVVSIIWALWGYSLAFGKSIGGIIGDLSNFALNGVGADPDDRYSGTIPALLFFFFQLKFAAITPALIIGAFAERINFKALLVFIALWATAIYAPIAHWIWNPDGWIHALGAVDFAGGTVVHIAAGVSALAAAIVIGRRNGHGNGTEFRPNNVPFVILGAALLWFGWFGFNAGSALAANSLAVSALVVTNIAAAAAAISWMATDWLTKGKPSAVGIAVGAVCGLVAITPASGYVTPLAAAAIGLVAGVISNLVANWRSKRTLLDDSLDVFACHGVSGIWGALATGLFATLAVNTAGVNGLFYGNPGQLLAQIIAIVAVAAYSFAGSFAILKLQGKFMKLRVSTEEEEKGLDHSQHGEEAYA